MAILFVADSKARYSFSSPSKKGPITDQFGPVEELEDGFDEDECELEDGVDEDECELEDGFDEDGLEPEELDIGLDED